MAVEVIKSKGIARIACASIIAIVVNTNLLTEVRVLIAFVNFCEQKQNVTSRSHLMTLAVLLTSTSPVVRV